jgi:hypothetical protein
MQRRVPSLKRIADLIGFRPTRRLDDILADVIREQRARLEASQRAKRNGSQ